MIIARFSHEIVSDGSLAVLGPRRQFHVDAALTLEYVLKNEPDDAYRRG
jgi:hypothetical protein